MNEQIEWHNNNAYNNGKSALEVYLKDKCRTQDNEVNGKFKNNGRGHFDETVFKASENGSATTRGGKKGLIIAGIAAAAVIAGIAIAKISGKNKSEKQDGHLSCVG